MCRLKTCLLGILCFFFALLAEGSDRFRSYEERAFWEKPDAGQWAAVRGFNASWGSTDERYGRTEPYQGKRSRSLVLEGWRGERVFAQAVLWTK